MEATQRLRRLKWRCRRGMKELDLLLGRFMDARGDALEQGAWPELEELLNQEDDRLWDWLQEPATAAPAYRQLLHEILDAGA